MFFTKAKGGLYDWFRYLMTIIAVSLAYAFLGQLPLMSVLMYKMTTNSDLGMDALEEFQTNMNFELFGIDKNVGLVLMILIFAISLIALWLCVKYIHKLPFKRLITPNASINYGKIFFGFGVWFVLACILEYVFYLMSPESYIFSFNPSGFFVLIIICVLFLPIQTSFEELFFRGYLMPGIGLLTKNKWLPLLITSILFGLIHGANPEVSKYGFWTMQLYYVSAGLFLGLITVLDDSLELALGVHAATNIFGASILSYEGSVLQTDTLFKSAEINPNLMTIGFIASASIFVGICLMKYKWNGFSRLFDDEIEKT